LLEFEEFSQENEIEGTLSSKGIVEVLIRVETSESNETVSSIEGCYRGYLACEKDD